MLVHVHTVNLCLWKKLLLYGACAEQDRVSLKHHGWKRKQLALEMVFIEEDKLHVKQNSIFKTNVCRSTAQAHFCCMRAFVLVCASLVSFGLCGGRRFPVIPFMQPKSKAWAADWKGGTPIGPCLSSLLHVVQQYLSRKLLWMSAWCHVLPSGFMAFCAYLPPSLKSLSPRQSDHPSPFCLRSCSHALEFPPAVCSQEGGCYVAILCAACN